MIRNGRVVEGHSDFLRVLSDGEELLCRIRGRMRLDEEKPLPGDLVEIEQKDGDEQWRIRSIAPRQSLLHRPLIANVDTAIVVFTLTDPEGDWFQLDELLIAIVYDGIEPLIVLNKTDLTTDDKVVEFLATYGTICPVYPVQATQGVGFNELREAFTSPRLAVLAGSSGVGKSSIMQYLLPEVPIQTGDLSVRSKRGKHTTRTTRLYPLMASFIADTPGFSSIEIPLMEPQDLSRYFPEYADLRDQCRFTPNCIHKTEPDCAVRQVVETGQVPRNRYLHYLQMLDGVRERWEHRW